MPDTLAGKTTEELRKLARARGLSGYSKIRKSELLRLLRAENKSASSSPAGKKRRKTAAVARTPGKPAKRRAAAPATKPAPVTVPPRPGNGGHTEQQIESSKYALVAPGQAPYAQRFSADLGENLDYLPAPTEPVICLLPQKPGVLHAYWSFNAALPVPLADLRLRLGRLLADGVELVEEVSLPAPRGHWYFHVDESVVSGDFYLHLGSYRDGHFVTAIRRGIARAPRLFASTAIDRRWWIDEERFNEMYLRAGGVMRHGRLAWPGSASSPGGAGDSTLFSRRVDQARG